MKEIVILETVIIRSMKNTAILVLFLSLIVQYDSFAQNEILIEVPEHDTLILKGKASALKCPCGTHCDTTIINFDRWVVIYKYSSEQVHLV